MMKISRAGFTLAEVLTTLMVIGVVAAMTIPTLMNNTTDQQFRVAYRKAMSVLGQGVQLMVARDEECGVYADTANADLAECMANVISGTRANEDGEVDADGNVIVTPDGMAYAFYFLGTPLAADQTRSLVTLCGRANAQFNDAETSYDGTDAECLVVVDFNGPNRGSTTFTALDGNALSDGSLAGDDQQVIHLTGEGVRPVWVGANNGSPDVLINQGYQYMFGENASPFEAAAGGGGN